MKDEDMFYEKCQTAIRWCTHQLERTILYKAAQTVIAGLFSVSRARREKIISKISDQRRRRTFRTNARTRTSECEESLGKFRNHLISGNTVFTLHDTLDFQWISKTHYKKEVLASMKMVFMHVWQSKRLQEGQLEGWARIDIFFHTRTRKKKSTTFVGYHNPSCTSQIQQIDTNLAICLRRK